LTGRARGDHLWVKRRFPAVLLAGLSLLAGCSGGDDDGEATRTITETVARTQSAGGARAVTFGDVPELVDRVQPSIVSVTTDVGEGSGVIWSDDGLIVTNHHVVDGAQQIEVVLASGAELEARVRASTPDYDLAMLEVDRDGLPEATFARGLPEVGELAIAMGNPLGLEQSVTAGIVSGLHRSVPAAGATPSLVDLVQTDAAISPGNSGGALVNAEGEVIGVNVAYVPPNQGGVALGFSIPSPTVIDVVRQLLEAGRVQQSYLGIQNPVPVTEELAQQFGLGVEEGVAFVAVTPDGPAARAGLRPGDVIVAVDGNAVDGVDDLFAELRRRRPGERVTLTIVRGDDRRQIAVTLGEKPPS
jgi:S1-C subfamily serine protease